MADLKKMLMRGLEAAVPGGAMAGATTRAVKSALKNIEKNKKMDEFDQLIKDGKIENFIDFGVEPKKNVSKSLRPKIRPKSTSLRPKIRPDANRQRAMDRASMLEALEAAEMGMMSDADSARLRKQLGMKRGGKVKKMKDGGLVGGQVKLDKNKDGKISGADFKMMENGGAVRKKKGKSKKSGGAVCRGAGAAIKGTRFSGVR